ncbi:hypothetical protein Vadar_002191 [Vaccinium darrowii]|uniref:Uncharacterized protein n=1 Tax=Vaccinium darrowii TaxID=229202 RepID=A0ACB7YCN0_9ERIC|nr:hypothetical protein Vadar_002191 [Vaccinium darrowii]
MLFASQGPSVDNPAPNGYADTKYKGFSHVLDDLDSFQEFDRINGFLLATGANYKVSDSQKSYFDMKEARDQVFSPPLYVLLSTRAAYMMPGHSLVTSFFGGMAGSFDKRVYKRSIKSNTSTESTTTRTDLLFPNPILETSDEECYLEEKGDKKGIHPLRLELSSIASSRLLVLKLGEDTKPIWRIG